jgi:hypothetical protein
MTSETPRMLGPRIKRPPAAMWVPNSTCTVCGQPTLRTMTEVEGGTVKWYCSGICRALRHNPTGRRAVLTAQKRYVRMVRP